MQPSRFASAAADVVSAAAHFTAVYSVAAVHRSSLHVLVLLIDRFGSVPVICPAPKPPEVPEVFIEVLDEQIISEEAESDADLLARLLLADALRLDPPDFGYYCEQPRTLAALTR